VPDIASLLADLAATLGGWTYLLVAGLAFLETGAFVGLIAPGETAVAGSANDNALAALIASPVTGEGFGPAFDVSHMLHDIGANAAAQV